MNMLAVSIIILIIGGVFIIAELHVPGGFIMGAIGALLIIVSGIITIANIGPFGLLVFTGEICCLGLVVVAAFNHLKKSQQIGKLILKETLGSGKDENVGLDYFLGKEGVTKTSLRPFGYADFNGVSAEVCSDGKYIAENKRIKVMDVSKQKLIVTQIGQ